MSSTLLRLLLLTFLGSVACYHLLPVRPVPLLPTQASLRQGTQFPTFTTISSPSSTLSSSFSSTFLRTRIKGNKYATLHMTSTIDPSVKSRPFSTIPPAPPLPSHPELLRGTLENGFTYVILPNSNPAGRFEAYLEILSGSAHELESQQGMAHLVEHIAYMGSPIRQEITGTGSRTNAFTDFHHTVFFAACPTQMPANIWKKPMMPKALGALLDVMTAKVDNDRLEKERAAVLSEASMVNKMEYRVECQVLSALHEENRISYRFPIGKENLIKAWRKEDVQTFHDTHYRPDNVILFVVGDVDVPSTIQTIKEKFGGLKPRLNAKEIMAQSGEFPEHSMYEVHRHFPPVVHRWSCAQDIVASRNIPEPLINPAPLKTNELLKNGMLPQPRIFSHELLQSFSFHLFAKRPIEPVVDSASLRKEIMRRIALSALQIRFNVQQRQDPLFTFVDFNQLNWPREGCAVCSLDLTTDTEKWKDAVKMAVHEIRRLGQYGLTVSELKRYKQAILADAEQAAAQSDQMGNEDIVYELMEATACGHTYMHPTTRAQATAEAIDTITLADMKAVCVELCEHLSDIQPELGVRPAAIIACAPVFDRNKNKFVVTDKEVADVIADALKDPLEPIDDAEVPTTLYTPEELAAKKAAVNPKWVPLEGKAAAAAAASGSNPFGISQKRLSNGMRVNLISMDTEPQRAAVRLYVPGGRILESKDKPGSVLVGARTLQEGGAFLSMTREEVELFCIDHLVMVDIIATEDALVFDFQTVTTPGPDGVVTGLEAVMQVAHIIMTDFKYEADALERAKQSFHEHYDSIVKGLESSCHETIVTSLTNGDGRFTAPNHAHIDALDLDTVKDAIVSQLGPDAVEVSIAADAPMDYLEDLALTYLGTVPPRDNKRVVDFHTQEAFVVAPQDDDLKKKSKDLKIHLIDSDERAMGYLAGPCPNRWGYFADGSTISQKMKDFANQSKIKLQDKDLRRREHPLFGNVALMVFQEVTNRRLFSVVREERQLTYDASFMLMGHESLKGGWYLVSVTSSPQKVQAAVQACKEALESLKGPNGITSDSVQSSKRTILNRFRSESTTNRFWIDNMSGTQLECIPNKTLKSITDFEEVLNGITVQDIQMLVDALALDESMTSCVGTTGP